MKRLFVLISACLLFISCYAEPENWQVIFHPGDKMGLPDRFACTYEASDYTLMFRSDLDAFKVVIYNGKFDGKIDYFGSMIDTVKIMFYTNDNVYKGSTERLFYIDKESRSAGVLHDDTLINWIMNDGRVKIEFHVNGQKYVLHIWNIDYRKKIIEVD